MATEDGTRRRGLRILGIAAVVFGVMTLIEGGRMLFGGAEARAGVDPIVEFVLIFTFGAGGLYVVTGLVTLRGHRAARGLAWLLAVSTIGVSAALAVHIANGGAFMTRTPWAMAFRAAFWLTQAILLGKFLRVSTPAA